MRDLIPCLLQEILTLPEKKLLFVALTIVVVLDMTLIPETRLSSVAVTRTAVLDTRICTTGDLLQAPPAERNLSFAVNESGPRSECLPVDKPSTNFQNTRSATLTM